jgi:hypothetical protein
MEKYFVGYNQALALKELGFDEPCFGFYDDIDKQFYQIHSQASSSNDVKNITKAPLKQQVFKWFRDKHQLDGWAVPYYSSNEKLYSFLIENGIEENLKDSDEDYKTNEEAESACIDKLIEIVKNK